MESGTATAIEAASSLKPTVWTRKVALVGTAGPLHLSGLLLEDLRHGDEHGIIFARLGD